jgi:hypothetical protein
MFRVVVEQLIPPPREVVMEATPAVQNIHVKNKLFPDVSACLRRMRRSPDLQDAVTRYAGEDATGRMYEYDAIYGAEEDSPPRGEYEESDAVTELDGEVIIVLVEPHS